MRKRGCRFKYRGPITLVQWDNRNSHPAMRLRNTVWSVYSSTGGAMTNVVFMNQQEVLFNYWGQRLAVTAKS